MQHNTQHILRNTLIIVISFIGGIITTVVANTLSTSTSQSLADSLLLKIEEKVASYSSEEKLAYFTLLHADIPTMIDALSIVDLKIVKKIDSIKSINDASVSVLDDLVDTPTPAPVDKMVKIIVRNSAWSCGNPDSNNYTTYSPSYAADGSVTVNVTYCLTKGNSIWNSCPNGKQNIIPLDALTEGKTLTCSTSVVNPTPTPAPVDKMVKIIVRNSAWSCGNPDSNNYTTYSPSYAADGSVTVNVTYCLTKGNSIWNSCPNGKQNIIPLDALTEGKTLTCSTSVMNSDPNQEVNRNAIGIQSSRLSDPDFTFERINTSTGQYLKLFGSTNVNRVLYKSVGTTSTGANIDKWGSDVNKNLETMESWENLHNGGWPAGIYNNTWTVILFQGGTKTFTETFYIK